MDTGVLVNEILKALTQRHNVLLYGPPGTGKTYLMNKVRALFVEPNPPVFLKENAETDFFEALPFPERPCRMAWWITFHQSYSYEDFVVGLRTTSGPGFQLEPKQGPLLEAAAHARLSDGASLILIDEINRGNTSRIFGELITVMESSKRLAPDGSPQPDTVDVMLPHIPASGLSFELKRPCEESPKNVSAMLPFAMPHYVYILASMNSVDKTVAPLDAALRRRFHIIELEPDYELLADHFKVAGDPEQYGTLPSDPNNPDYWRRLAIRLLFQINRRIRSLVGEDFQLGHSYLLPLADESTVPGFKQGLKDLLERSIVPQLREMLRASPATLAAALAAVDPGVDLWYPYRFEEIPSELADVGAQRPLRVSSMDIGELEKVVRRLGAVS